MASRRGVKEVRHVSVDDLHEQMYINSLFEACKLVYRMISIGHTVFLQDATGISRVSTLVVAFLSMYMQVDYYNDIDKVGRLVTKSHPLGMPNNYVIKKLFKQKFDIDWFEDLKKILEKERLLKEAMAQQIDRLNQLNHWKKEYERLRN